EPTVPEREIERVRGELLNDLRIEADDTHLRAMRELERFVFPNDHPYGRDPKGGADRVRRIRRRDIVAFHEAHVNPEALILAVTGDVDRRRMEDAIAEPLARLDASSEALPAGVNPANLSKATRSIHEELDRLQTDPFHSDEVRDGKDNQVGSLIVSLERNAEVASELHRMEYYGLGMGFLERYPEIVRGLEEDRVREVAMKYFTAEGSSMVVAGPVGRARLTL